jgi:hypothetical protein
VGEQWRRRPGPLGCSSSCASSLGPRGKSWSPRPPTRMMVGDTLNLALFLIAFLPSLISFSCFLFAARLPSMAALDSIGPGARDFALPRHWVYGFSRFGCCSGCPFFECLCRATICIAAAWFWDSVETRSVLQVLNLVLLGGVVKTSYFLVMASSTDLGPGRHEGNAELFPQLFS